MLKKYLIPGLLIWLPLGATLWILDFVLSTLDRTLVLLPRAWQPDELLGFHIPGLGLILTVLIVFGTGALARNLVGRQMLRWWEDLLARIPIVRSIYSSVKQVSDTMLSPKGNAFRKVVLVEFPQPGQWTLAFVVGEPSPPVERKIGAGLVTVYVPTAPNPTSGYVLFVTEDKLRDADITVDDALKFHVSLGVVVPGGAHPPAPLAVEPKAGGQ